MEFLMLQEQITELINEAKYLYRTNKDKQGKLNTETVAEISKIQILLVSAKVMTDEQFLNLIKK